MIIQQIRISNGHQFVIKRKQFEIVPDQLEVLRKRISRMYQGHEVDFTIKHKGGKK
jgi:hypothetical protein